MPKRPELRQCKMHPNYALCSTRANISPKPFAHTQMGAMARGCAHGLGAVGRLAAAIPLVSGIRSSAGS